MIAAGVVLLVAYSDDDEPRTPEVAQVAATATPQTTATPAPTPTLEPTPVSMAPIARVEVSSVAINARVIVLGVDSAGTMQSPNNPRDVAWYNFSSRPGHGGNVVLAAHVDYVNYGPAVFWRLRDLKPGDQVTIILEDGVKFTYDITDLTAYDEATAPVLEIVGPTDSEVITLITCTGTFSSRTHDYNKRLVVRGVPSRT